MSLGLSLSYESSSSSRPELMARVRVQDLDSNSTRCHAIHNLIKWSKSYPTASINHRFPPNLPVSKYFIPASFTPAKVLGALYSIPQAQAKSNQLIEEDMNNCKRSLISKCLKLGTPAHTSGPQEQFPPTSTFKIMIYFGLCNFLSITTKLFVLGDIRRSDTRRLVNTGD